MPSTAHAQCFTLVLLQICRANLSESDIGVTGLKMTKSCVFSSRSVVKLAYIYGQMCYKCMGKLNAHIRSNMQQIYGQKSISVPVGSYLIIIGILLICVTATCKYFLFP